MAVSVHRKYENAHAAAVTLARQLGRETGILKAKEYDYTVYQVLMLPKPQNRFGFEARAQVIPPDEPYMTGGGPCDPWKSTRDRS